MKYPFINYFSNRSGTIELPTLNSTLNRLLKEHNGEIYSYYVKSSTYKLYGIVFTTKEVEQKEAEIFFETELSKTIKIPKNY